MGRWVGSPLTTSVGDLPKGEMSNAAELEFFFKKLGDNLQVWFKEVGEILHLKQEGTSNLGRIETSRNRESGEGRQQ